MNAPFKQQERLGRLTTELGEDSLVLLRFNGTEYLNDLFEFHVEAHEMMKPLDGIITSASWMGLERMGTSIT